MVSQMPTDLRFYRAVLARRWMVILPVVILAPLVALLLAASQRAVYSATAQVLLTYSNPGASVSGVADTYPATAPDRNVATQTALARNSAVAQDALLLSHVDATPADLLNASNVSSPNNADLLNFTVDSPSPSEAISLATNYAQAYIDYRGRMTSDAINSALASVTAELGELAKARKSGTATYRTLSREQQTLLATGASGTNDTVLAQPAQSASEVGPHPVRSAAVGLALGITLALALVLLIERFDQRVPAEEAERRLRLPLLGSIPATRGWRRRARALRKAVAPGARHVDAEPPVVLRDPNGREARAFRVLKSSLEVARLKHDFKSLFFTSTPYYGGQPAAVANLAVTLAQAGHRVLLCDLTGTQSSVGTLFQVGARPGVIEVALGSSSLEDAVVSLDYPSLVSPVSRINGVVAANGDTAAPRLAASRYVRGSLDVLAFGAPPPHSGFVGSKSVANLVEELKGAPYDLVLLDAPPLLDSGEAETVSTSADAVVIILPDPVPLRTLDAVTATLSRLPMRALGFVTVGTGSGVGEVRAPAAELQAQAPDRDRGLPTAISSERHEGHPAPNARRMQTFRPSPRFVDKLREP